MNWDLRTWRSNLRLISAPVLLSFVICHLTAHCLLLISFDSGDAARDTLMYPWRTWIGTGLLMTALLVHYANALWSIYTRRSLRLSHWEWAQLLLGLCIPMLVMTHVVGTRIAESVLDVHNNYKTVFIAQWVAFPWLGHGAARREATKASAISCNALRMSSEVESASAIRSTNHRAVLSVRRMSAMSFSSSATKES